jgi:hypothetical protein
MMAYAVILTTWGQRLVGLQLKARLGKSSQTSFQPIKKMSMVAHA